MKCPKCQFDNPEGAKFCNECGNKLEISCPECGKVNPLGSKFCSECGHDLKAPKEAPPIDYSQPQSYTPKFLADKILTTRSSIEGERKLVTVLFADVANYTSISEKLDPEEVHQIMDGCFKILMDEIHRYEGTINQFTGDGVMALFGAPLAHEDHAQRACHAALSIQKAIRDYAEEIKKDCGIEFKMRIGLNSGPVIVGSIGDDLRMDYTAVGDTTNMAARMEATAKPGSTLVSKDTYRLVKDFFELDTPAKIKVKGKKEEQEAYELTQVSEIETRFRASVAKGLTRFVGRENSMAALMEAYDKVQSGSGQVLGIVGEAGVGKSRLLLEFRNLLPQAEFSFVEGRCLHYGGSMSYLPILDILRSYFDIKEGEREFVIKKKIKDKTLELDEKLEGVIPPFQELLSLKVDDEAYLKIEPKEKREKTFEAIRDLLIRESQNKTLLLAFEDLHWIDKTSEELLDYLIGWLANTPILLILLYRPEYTHQWGSKSYYSKIGLDQLTTESSIELVKAMLEGGEVVPELRELILNRASGNPLFMEELTHTLLENGTIERKGREYVLSSKVSDIQVPDTIQGIIAARMDRLEDSLKRTMQVASVIGTDFAFRILQTITGMREELKSYLLNLQGLEFIYEKSLFPELEYIFKHALTQEVAYNSLLLKRRKEIHEKIGQAIEKLYPERLEEFYEMLAYHYSKSENLEKAYLYLKMSGEKVAANYSNWEAYGFYKEAISALNKMPQTEEIKRKQIEVRVLAGTNIFVLGFPEDSIQILEEGERLSKEVRDEKGLVHFYGFKGAYYSIKGDPLLALRYHESSFIQAQKIRDIELVALSASSLVFSYQPLGEYLKIVNIASKVLPLFEETKRESEIFVSGFNAYSLLLAYYGSSMGWLGNFAEGKNLCEKGLKFSLEINNLPGLALLELMYGQFFFLKGEGRNSVEHLQNSVRYSEQAQIAVFLGLARSLLGAGYYLLGELGTARTHMERGLKIHIDIGRESLLSLHYVFLSMVHFDSGDLKNAQHSLEKALDLSQKNGEKSWEGISRIWLGRIMGKADISQSDKAEECIVKGIEILDRLKLKPVYTVGYFFLGELYTDAGQREKALENLKKAKGMFQEMGMDYWLARTRDVLGRLKG